MDVQLVRVCIGTDNVQVLGPLRGAEKVSHSERGSFPIPKHVPIGERREFGERYKRLFANG